MLKGSLSSSFRRILGGDFVALPFIAGVGDEAEVPNRPERLRGQRASVGSSSPFRLYAPR